MDEFLHSCRLFVLLCYIFKATDLYSEHLNEKRSSVEFFCPNSSNIQIENITVINTAVGTCHGPHKNCVQDTDFTKCNNKKSCRVHFNQSTTFLKKFGFVNLTYTCRESDKYCNFEIDFCDWKRELNSNTTQVWARASEDWAKKDHTTNSGYGNYITIKNDGVAQLKSSRVFSRSPKCLIFWYKANTAGRQQQEILKIIVYKRTAKEPETSIWDQTLQLNKWTQVKVNLTFDAPYEIVIEGMINKLYNDNKTVAIAIDDVDIFGGKCPDYSKIQCDFERDHCGLISRGGIWTHALNEKLANDHTTGKAHGRYYQIDNRQIDKTGELIKKFSSPIRCLTFWYYIYGKKIHSFEVLHGKRSLFSIDINLKDRWHYKEIDLDGHVTHDIILKVHFEDLARNNKPDGGIAVDDLIFSRGSCEETIIQECNEITDAVHIEQCAGRDIKNGSITIDIESRKHKNNLVKCMKKRQQIQKQIAAECENLADETCVLRLESFLNDANDCFVVSEIDGLQIDYTCADVTRVSQQITAFSPITGILAGVIGGVVAIICLVVLMVFSCRRFANVHDGGKNKSENIDLPSIINNYERSVYFDVSRQTNTTGANSKPLVTNPQYEVNYELRNQDFFQNTKFGNANPHCNYEILDPEVTGFNRMNENEGAQYELASSLNSDLIGLKFDTNADSKPGNLYATVEDGKHDATDATKSDLAVSEKNIYSHSMDGVYDISNHARQDYDTENTYDHVVTE